MTLREIEDAIRRLPKRDLVELAGWFAEFQALEWDAQIERDLDAGRLDALLRDVDAECDAGEPEAL